MELINEKCMACRPDAPRVSDIEIMELLPQIPNWRVIEKEGILRLIRSFKFKDFASSLEFAVGVGHVAEEEGHHPSLTVEWGRCTVEWWTHKIRGLHHNDFIMAAKSDKAYERFLSGLK